LRVLFIKTTLLKGLRIRKLFAFIIQIKIAKRIDVIREMIEAWKHLGLLNENEFYVLLYALISEASRCANTTGTMSSFLKHYSRKALQEVRLKVPEIISSVYQHEVYCENSINLLNTLDTIDILYIDPPYTMNQYAASYHLLETIARWDFPELYGISGKRDTTNLYSPFSSKRRALGAIERVLASNCYKHLLMSYSSDGIVPHDTLMQLLRRYGEVSVYRQLLKRYNTMSQNDPRVNQHKFVEECLYYLKPHKINPSYPANTMATTINTPILSNFQPIR